MTASVLNVVFLRYLNGRDMSKVNDTEPLYQQVKSYIADKIFSGELTPGSRVPSENELVRIFSVSRMTSNRALTELTTEGLLTRIHGKGTFVAQTQTTGRLLRVRSIAEEVKERGRAYRFDVLRHELEAPPADISVWMGLEPDEQVCCTEIVHRENDVPLQLERRLVSLAAAPIYQDIDLTESTPSEFLLQNVPLQRVEHKVRAVMPTPSVAEALAIETTIPCLLLERKTWSRDTPVSYVDLYHRGDQYALSDSFSQEK
ncbi:MAG: histidine utilization repressor [Gammaproteobacteria bacterium]